MSMVLEERRGSVAILTLNHPAQYNALTCDLMPERIGTVDRVVANQGWQGFLCERAIRRDTFERSATIGYTMRQSINPVIEKLRGAMKSVVTALTGQQRAVSDCRRHTNILK